ncbi:MAG: hypothetical protein ABI435_01070 [Pseudolysinimonas sp.]
MRLPELDPGQNAEFGKVDAALGDRFEVSRHIELRQPHVAGWIDVLLRVGTDVATLDDPFVGDVKMFGEHERRKPDPDRLLARAAHRTDGCWV